MIVRLVPPPEPPKPAPQYQLTLERPDAVLLLRVLDLTAGYYVGSPVSTFSRLFAEKLRAADPSLTY